MQKKIRTLVRTLCGESGEITLKLSLMSQEGIRNPAPHYGISAETEGNFSLAMIPADFKEATRVFETLFKDGVTPVTLQDIIRDMYYDAV
ncbi:MAG: hypothetical protein J5590_07025 [Clostridia bacterium]|nr:hypothetical protein [Clostridia bacterium]